MKLHNPDHLAFVRTMPCSIAGKRGHVCGGVIEAMHYRGSKDGGGSIKPGDNWTMPGCTLAHREQHNIGEPAFERKYGISMREICELTWAMSDVRDHIVIGRPKRSRKPRKAKPRAKRKLPSRPFPKAHRPLRRKLKVAA